MDFDSKINESDDNVDDPDSELGDLPPCVRCTHENLPICWANKLEPDDINYFHDQMQSMLSLNDQLSFLSKFLKSYDTKGLRNKCIYYVQKQNGEMIRVCQKSFRSITKISRSKIRCAQNNCVKANADDIFARNEIAADQNFKNRRNIVNLKWHVLFERHADSKAVADIQKDNLIYPCFACLDTFNQLECLTMHIYRRSYLIRFRCKICGTVPPQKFHNSCQLLLHIRSHSIRNHLTNQVYNLNDIDILPLRTDSRKSGYCLNQNNIESTKFLRCSQIDQQTNIDLSNVCVEVFDFVIINVTEFNDKLKLCYFKLSETNQLPCKVQEIKLNQQTLQTTHKRAFDDWFKLNGNSLKNQPKLVIFNTKKFTYIVNRVVGSSDDIESTASLGSLSDENLNVCRLQSNNNLGKQRSLQNVSDSGSSSSSSYNSRCLDSWDNCSECGNKVEDIKDHFSIRKSRECSLIYCTICPWFTINSCSYKAHFRFHEKIPPYTCPECGKVFQNVDFYSYHLTNECLHLIRKLRIRCFSQNCRKFFTSLRSLRTHFWSAHLVVDSYFCEHKCRRRFMTEEEHPAECGAENLERMFHCTVCPDILIKAKELPAHSKIHFQLHLINYIFVYFCDKCKFAFNKEKNYLLHREACSTTRSNKRRIEGFAPLELSSSVSTFSGATGDHSVISEFDDNFDPDTPLPTKQAKISETITTAKKTSPPPLSILKETLVSSIQETTNVSTVVTNSLPSLPLPSSSTMTTTTTTTTTTSTMATMAISAEESKTAPKFKQCAVCNVQVNVSSDLFRFNDHIREHKNPSALFQCTECGECFAARSLLENHLRAVHKFLPDAIESMLQSIEDDNLRDDVSTVDETADAFVDNDDNDVGITSVSFDDHEQQQQQPEEQRVPNQCTVCKMILSNEDLYLKHIRKHGLVFLRHLK